MDPILDHAPCGFLRFDHEGMVRLVNHTLLDLLGYETEELVGKPVERILTIGSRVFYQTHWFPLLRLHGSSEEIFLMLRPASGEDIGTLVNGVRREEGGEVVYDCVLVQVRERRRYEDELLRARRAAEQAQARLEHQKQEMERANALLEEQTAAMAVQQRRLEEEAARAELAGEELRVLNRELSHAAQALEASNRELDQFAYVASHDLKAPLRGIANLATWIEEDIAGEVSPEVKQHLELLRSRVNRMERLIDGILEYSRAGHVQDPPVRIDAAELVREVVQLIAPPEHVRIDVAEQMPIVWTERLPLQQVFMNLIGNAVKYAGGDVPLVAISARDAGEQWEFAVRDTGPGIPLEFQDRIFGIFQKLEARDHVEGTGIGLSIVKKLVEGRGGRVWVDSAPGAGSTFRFMWPKAPDESSTRAA